MKLPEDVQKVIENRPLEKVTIEVVYKNYRGETSKRKIIPLRPFYGSTDYHKQEQWLLDVWDLDKEAYRTYAMKDIQKWEFPRQ